MLTRTLALAVGLTLSDQHFAGASRRYPEGQRDSRRSPHRTAAQIQAAGRLPGTGTGHEGGVRAGGRLRRRWSRRWPPTRIDMAWLGGFTFVQARLKTGNAVPAGAARAGRPVHQQIHHRRPGGEIPADLKGKTFAFGSVSSTSGSLMPRYFMLKDGIKPETSFSRVAYSGAHDATAAWVQAGKVDAGVLNASVWEKLVGRRQGRHQQGQSLRHHPDLLRLQLDRARHPRPDAGREDQGGVPRPRPGQTASKRRSSICRPPAASSNQP